MIQIETTPNPESLKFLSENIISATGTEEFQKNDIKKIENSFIRELLGFRGVELVLLSKNFLSVKKTQAASWDELKPMVISHLNHYFANNQGPILKDDLRNKDKDNEQENDKIVKKIIDVLDTKIRPAVAKDGGDIKFESFEKGVVKVKLQGSCSGCPSSLMTLKQGVQNLLKHYVKEVNSVEAN
jgi:Fe-S cluster biogenesis protein NfuA